MKVFRSSTKTKPTSAKEAESASMKQNETYAPSSSNRDVSVKSYEEPWGTQSYQDPWDTPSEFGADDYDVDQEHETYEDAMVLANRKQQLQQQQHHQQQRAPSAPKSPLIVSPTPQSSTQQSRRITPPSSSPSNTYEPAWNAKTDSEEDNTYEKPWNMPAPVASRKPASYDPPWTTSATKPTTTHSYEQPWPEVAPTATKKASSFHVAPITMEPLSEAPKSAALKANRSRPVSPSSVSVASLSMSSLQLAERPRGGGDSVVRSSSSMSRSRPSSPVRVTQQQSTPLSAQPLQPQTKTPAQYEEFHQMMLERQTWYHGPLSRTDAEAILKSTPMGTYLVRAGSLPGSYTLSFTMKSGVRHVRLQRENGVYVVGNSSPSFESIIELLLYFSSHEVQIVGTDTWLSLKKPLAK